MSKKVVIGIGIVLILGIATIIAYVLRPIAEASAPIEAVPVQLDETQSELESKDEVQTVQKESENSANINQETVIGEEVEQLNESEMDVAQDVIIFTIMQEGSQVRFTLDELLRGNPTTVIGRTNQVAGEIAIDVENPVNVKLGTILVNARTLVTDNEFRNRAINNEILETDDFEFVTFTPTAIAGIPIKPEIGEELSLQITGDLTIRDITQVVTFDALVVVNSQTSITGYASTMVSRTDFQLDIPEVSSVANVDEEVLLEIEFSATNQQ